MAEAGPFAVVELQREARDPMALARALASARGTPVQDQVRAAKDAWGIVAEDLGEEEARELGTTLRAAGVPCAVGPMRALVELPDAEPATARASLPPGAPALVAVAGLTLRTSKTVTETIGPSAAQKVASKVIMLGTGLPIKIGGGKRKVEKTQHDESLAFYVDLVYRDPFRRVRVAASDFDFSCLGARMLYQTLGNCKLLVADLVAEAPEAWRNHGARVLLEGRPMRTMGYGSLDDLEREERWLMTLRQMEEKGGREAS